VVPVTLEEYRLEVGRGQVRRPHRDALAVLLGQSGFSGEQIDTLGTGFAGEGLIFIKGPSGSGKTHLLNALGQALEGVVRIPHAIAVGDRVLEVFDPDVHRPVPKAGGDARTDRRWVHCAPPVIRAGAEISVQMFDPRCDPATGRTLAPIQIKANDGLLLIDDLDAAGSQARALIGRWRMLLESGIDRLRFPDGTAFEFPVSARVVVTSTLAPETLGGEALVRRLAGRVDLDEWSECVYRQWVDGLYRTQGCESPEDISTWLVGMHRAGGLPRVPGIAARLLQIAHDGARYRGERGPLDRHAFERAWQVHRGLAGPAARLADPTPRRGTIATPPHRRVSGSIDVRNRQPRHSA
jgi:energy-coupling factor transporter ATP-binding protein EcfA2